MQDIRNDGALDPEKARVVVAQPDVGAFEAAHADALASNATEGLAVDAAPIDTS